MNKVEIRDTIYKCALLYDDNLCNNQVMFVYRDGLNHVDYIEVPFRSHNFMHFTGVVPRNGLSANNFYRLAKAHKLGTNDFDLNNSHTTELKLGVLSSIMNIDKVGRMIGDYNGPYIDLYTEKVTGTTTACLGLIHKSNMYLPNSVLKEDIRDITQKPPGKIFAIFKKSLKSQLYTQITYKSKNTDLTKYFNSDILLKLSPDLLVQ